MWLRPLRPEEGAYSVNPRRTVLSAVYQASSSAKLEMPFEQEEWSIQCQTNKMPFRRLRPLLNIH